MLTHNLRSVQSSWKLFSSALRTVWQDAVMQCEMMQLCPRMQWCQEASPNTTPQFGANKCGSELEPQGAPKLHGSKFLQGVNYTWTTNCRAPNAVPTNVTTTSPWTKSFKGRMQSVLVSKFDWRAESLGVTRLAPNQPNCPKRGTTQTIHCSTLQLLRPMRLNSSRFLKHNHNVLDKCNLWNKYLTNPAGGQTFGANYRRYEEIASGRMDGLSSPNCNFPNS